MVPTDNRKTQLEMKPSHLLALYRLSEMGATAKEVLYSTSDVAKGIGSSQQTASRRLIEMEKLGLIERARVGRDQKLRITGEGYRQLSDMYLNLKRVFEAPKKDLVINGTVFTGLSEGSYYMSLDGYRKQFISKLGFDPFPGTLNLRVSKEDLNDRKSLETYPFVYIEGFANEKRTYGPAKCFHATVNDEVKSAIVLPIRAHYGEDVVELIAPVSLRKRFKLKDGDRVSVRVPTKS
jgi:riboflavin kinase, archaea type